MMDDSDRDERVDDGAGDPAADDSALPEDRVHSAGGDEIDFSLLADERSAVDADDMAGDASRVDGLPAGWLDVDAAAARGGSGPLDLFAEADDALRGAGGAVEESGVSQASRVLIGTGQSGIVAASDVLAEAASQDPDRPDAGHGSGDATFAPAGTAGPVEAAPAGTPSDRGSTRAAVDEWGDLVAASGDDGPSESVGFGALLAQDAAEQAAASDSYADDSQGLVRGAEEAIEIAVPAIAAVRPRPARKGGAGQLVGVVLGGVMAIPVTLAILLWGFHRDPLGVTKYVPEGMRFLLPRMVRRSVEPRGQPVGGGSLDSIVSSAAANLPSAPGEEGGGWPPRTDVAATPDAVADAPGADPAPEVASVDTPAVLDPIAAAAEQSVPPAAEEPSLAIDAPPIPLGGAATSPVVRTPDLGPLEGAVEGALVATENLGRIDPSADPQIREQSLVAWYRGLAEVASALAVAEKAGSDVGGVPAEALRRYDGLAMRLASERVSDLADLGAMWLTASRRPSDGAVLVGVLEEERAAGPWRWGRLSVRGDRPRPVSFFSRTLDGVKPGDEVMVTGVLGDASAMWASDIRPVAGSRSVAPVDEAQVDAVPEDAAGTGTLPVDGGSDAAAGALPDRP